MAVSRAFQILRGEMSPDQVRDVMGASSLSVKSWLSGEKPSNLANRLASRIAADRVVRKEWIGRWFMEKTTGSHIPRRFRVVKERYEGFPHRRFVNRVFIEVSKQDRQRFIDDYLLYDGWSLIVSGDYLCYYQIDDEGRIIVDVVYVDDAGNAPALSTYTDPLCGVGTIDEGI